MRRSRQFFVFIALGSLTLASAPSGSSTATAPAPNSSPEVRHPEDLFIVDCLLPARVRSLGRSAKFIAPRKVVRLPAHECALRGGEYSADPSDTAWALQSWLAAAEGGDAAAADNVGEIYERGVRGAPDYGEAARWYRKAAEAGNRRAERNLGALYEQGMGVAADPAQAIAWYRKAAGLTGEAELSAEKEAAGLRDELAKVRADAEATRGQLATAEAALAAARTELASGEKQIAELKKKATLPAPAPDPAIAAHERELTAKRQKVAELEAAQDHLRTMLAELEAAEASGKRAESVSGATLLAKKAPAIEFVRPDVLATRGPTLAPVAAGTNETEVVGRVTAGLGVESFTVDGADRPVGSDGFFRVKIPVDPGRTIRFVAIDRAARRAEAELQFVVGGAPAPVAVAPVKGGSAAPAARARRSVLLVLADENYRDLPVLKTARSDGGELARVLKAQYGFETRLVENATFLDTMSALADLRKGLGPDDDLVVYFAGHGRVDAKTGQGYWLPVDARPDDPSTWLANAEIARQLDATAARHVLVISDSCYSGTLAASALDARVAASSARPRSRTVLTSGGLAPVLDEGGGDGHSIFARALLTVLKLARQATPAEEISAAVGARVAFKANQLGIAQTPEYAPIRYAGHEGGDFVFTPVG